MGPSRRRRSIAALAVVLGFLAGACGSDTPDSTTARATIGTGTGTGPLDVRNAAVGGGEIDFSTYAGKPVALWFWAPY